MFHAVTLERSSFRENLTYTCRPIPDDEYVVLFVERLIARELRYIACGQTHTHNYYRNPRCACVQRVNNVEAYLEWESMSRFALKPLYSHSFRESLPVIVLYIYSHRANIPNSNPPV